MDEQEILNQVTSVFATVFKRPDIVITPQTSAPDIRGWDSITHVMLIDGVEKKFGIKFKLMDVVKFKNVGDMVNSVKTKISAK